MAEKNNVCILAADLSVALLEATQILKHFSSSTVREGVCYELCRVQILHCDGAFSTNAQLLFSGHGASDRFFFKHNCNYPPGLDDGMDNGPARNNGIKKIDKTNRKLIKKRDELAFISNRVRVHDLGQDRYRRRYHHFAYAGGVFVEAVESCEPWKLETQGIILKNSI